VPAKPPKKKAPKPPTAAEIVEGFGDRGYWLLKSEPDAYGLDDLERDGKAAWTGVRNYQARNLMRDHMRDGDLVLYYHSNADPPAVVGLARIVGDAYPDPLQFQSGHKYFDPKATKDEPRWLLRDVAFEARFADIVPLADLKDDPALEDMLVTRRGQRLSVQPVAEEDFRKVCQMAGYDQP
jgi:predicted RNA-binding protein with PUA-like domain